MKTTVRNLFEMIAKGDRAGVLRALEHTNASVLDDHRVPALVAAARLGHVEIVRALLAKGAPINGRVIEAKGARFDDGQDELSNEFDEQRWASSRESALGAAIRLGHERVVDVLIAAGVELGAADGEDATPLSDAAAWGSVAIVRRLLEAGAGTERSEPLPLHVAARKGRADVVRLLLDAGAEVDARDEDGGTALIVAGLSGDVGTVEALVDAGADINRWCEGSNVLTNAAYAGSEALFSYLLERVDDSVRRSATIAEVHHAQERRRREADTPTVRLTNAAQLGRLKAVRAAIKSGTPLDTRGAFGLAALHFAARDNQPHVVDALLRAGANPDIGSDTFYHRDRVGSTPLHLLLWSFYDGGGEHTMITRLVDGGANPSACNDAGLSPLMVAVTEGLHRLPEIEALVRAGANIDQRDAHGNTALMMCVAWDRDANATALRTAGASEDGLREIELRRAAHAGNFERVQALIEEGAHVDHILTCTALSFAAGNGDAAIVRALLEAGASPDLRESPSDSTPLMHASYAGHLDVVELLLDAQIDPRARRSDSWTALDYARNGKRAGRNPERPWSDVIARLEAAGVPALRD